MQERFKEDALIRRYLLNDLDQDQQRQFEIRLLSDENFFEALLIEENEIIFDYITNTLSQQEKEHFESHFILTPERNQKIEFFKVLKKNIEGSPISDPQLHPSWKRFLPVSLRETGLALRFSLVVSLLLFLLGGTWLLIKILNMQNQRNQESYPIIFTATLLPDQMRNGNGSEMARLEIPPGVGIVRLRLQLAADNNHNYRAVLMTDRAVEVFSKDGLEAEMINSDKVVILDIPSNILARGDYQFKLSRHASDDDFDDVGRYYFRVLKN